MPFSAPSMTTTSVAPPPASPSPTPTFSSEKSGTVRCFYSATFSFHTIFACVCYLSAASLIHKLCDPFPICGNAVLYVLFTFEVFNIFMHCTPVLLSFRVIVTLFFVTLLCLCCCSRASPKYMFLLSLFNSFFQLKESKLTSPSISTAHKSFGLLVQSLLLV